MLSYQKKRAIVAVCALFIFTPFLLDAKVPFLYEAFFWGERDFTTITSIIILLLPGVFGASYCYKHKSIYYYASLGWLASVVLYRLHLGRWNFYFFIDEDFILAFFAAGFTAIFVWRALLFLGYSNSKKINN